eukprot:7753312-Pyramimonas_sp.AAC.1
MEQAPELGTDRGTYVGGHDKHAKRVAHADRQAEKARSGRRARRGARAVAHRGFFPKAAHACRVFGMAPSAALKWRRKLAT